jgi:hypothetical protein
VLLGQIIDTSAFADSFGREEKPTPCTDTGLIRAWARTEGGEPVPQGVGFGVEDEDVDLNGRRVFATRTWCLRGEDLLGAEVGIAVLSGIVES